MILLTIPIVNMGEKRRIGSGWALFFCITLSILIGFIIVICSPKKTNQDAYDNRIFWWAILLSIPIGIFGLFILYNLLSSPPVDFYDKIIWGQAAPLLFIGVGLIGLAIYYPYPPRIKQQVAIISPPIKPEYQHKKKLRLKKFKLHIKEGWYNTIYWCMAVALVIYLTILIIIYSI